MHIMFLDIDSCRTSGIVEQIFANIFIYICRCRQEQSATFPYEDPPCTIALTYVQFLEKPPMFVGKQDACEIFLHTLVKMNAFTDTGKIFVCTCTFLLRKFASIVPPLLISSSQNYTYLSRYPEYRMSYLAYSQRYKACLKLILEAKTMRLLHYTNLHIKQYMSSSLHKNFDFAENKSTKTNFNSPGFPTYRSQLHFHFISQQHFKFHFRL